MLTGIQNPLRRLQRDRRGVSAIEFAVIAPIMATLMLGAYDFGNAAQQQIDLQEAVRAGGAYALNHPTDVSGIQTIVTNSLPNGWTLTNQGAVAAVACSCLNPTNGATTALAGCTATNLANCTAPNAGIMVSITATMAYTAIDRLFAAAIPNNSATYVTRVQ
jgi:Flp pilus assembly protein TadG